MIETRLRSKRNRLQNISASDQTCYGCWQDPPEDIMQKILQHMSLDDSLRLSFVCKYWQSFATRRDMPSGAQLPWLVFPQPPNSQFLRFANRSKREVVRLNMPKPVKGVCFHASSKGWLIMFREKGLNTQLFLLNPLSGVQHKLPSLKTILTFQISFKQWSKSHSFVSNIVLCSPDITECIVAAFFNHHELGFCKPGDKRWSVFQVFDEYTGVEDIMFSGTTLYALLRHGYGRKSGTVEAHTLTYENHVVELKLIHDKVANLSHTIPAYKSYMLESSVLIYQMLARTFIDNDLGSRLLSVKTSGFILYKFDVECGNCLRVQNLEDQTLFLAINGSSLCLRASDFKELEGNCIYFATDEAISIFYLNTGKIERLFPDVDDLKGQKGWFTPSLW